MVKTYVKKPVNIEAVQFKDGNYEEIKSFCGNKCFIMPSVGDSTYVLIPTLEGNMHVSDEDYIIKGVNGEFYPCKPDIFEKTYSEIKE